MSKNKQQTGPILHFSGRQNTAIRLLSPLQIGMDIPQLTRTAAFVIRNTFNTGYLSTTRNIFESSSNATFLYCFTQYSGGGLRSTGTSDSA